MQLEILNTQLEKDLDLLGVTAVEDRLQPGAAQTVSCIRQAGIKTWMLTGDKEETAVNVAFACGLFDQSMHIGACVCVCVTPTIWWNAAFHSFVLRFDLRTSQRLVF